MNRIHQLLVAFDQFVSCLFGLFTGDSWADETFSAKCYRHKHRKPYINFIKLIDAVFFWQHEHCRKSSESEYQRRQLPPEYRTHD